MAEACNTFCHCCTKFGSSRSFGLKWRFIPGERRSCDTLPSKQVVTSLNSAFQCWMRRRSVLKKSITDGSPNSFSLPSTRSTGGEKVSHRTVSSLVLERISQVACTSDKLSKELSPGPFRREKYLSEQDEETMQREYPAGNERESPLRHSLHQMHWVQGIRDGLSSPHTLLSRLYPVLSVPQDQQ